MTAMGRIKEPKARATAIAINSPGHSQGCFSFAGVDFKDRANIKIPSNSTKVNSGSLAAKLL